MRALPLAAQDPQHRDQADCRRRRTARRPARARALARLASWTAVPSSFTVPTRRSRAACASARLRSVSLLTRIVASFLTHRRPWPWPRRSPRRASACPPCLKERMAQQREHSATSTSTPPTIRRRRPVRHDEGQCGDRGEQEREQREQHERERDGDEHRRLRVHLDLRADLGLRELDLRVDQRSEVLAQPAEQVLNLSAANMGPSVPRGRTVRPPGRRPPARAPTRAASRRAPPAPAGSACRARPGGRDRRRRRGRRAPPRASACSRLEPRDAGLELADQPLRALRGPALRGRLARRRGPLCAASTRRRRGRRQRGGRSATASR